MSIAAAKLCGLKKKEIDFALKKIKSVDGRLELIKILPNKSPLPSRFQLGLVSNINKQRIPNEVAFSAITSIEPLKRFHWGICSVGPSLKTKIIILDLKNLDVKKFKKNFLIFSFYDSKSKKVLQKKIINAKKLKTFESGVNINEIFQDLKKRKTNDFCYFSVFSPYGRFLCYTEVTNKFGSIFKEHTF